MCVPIFAFGRIPRLGKTSMVYFLVGISNLIPVIGNKMGAMYPDVLFFTPMEKPIPLPLEPQSPVNPHVSLTFLMSVLP